MADDLVNLAAIAVLEEVEIDAGNVGRWFHSFDDPFVSYTDNKFIKEYRLSKQLAMDLIAIVEPHLTIQSRESAISVPRKVLTALRFFASGSYQMDIGQNVNSGLSQTSVGRCIQEVTDAMNIPEIFNRYVSFPQNLQKLRQISQEFPGVIGCIDCTHVAIYPPKRDDDVYPEGAYVNRKGYHSINVQLICDHTLKILNVNARYPGSTNDSFIWSNSNVLPFLENLHANGNNSFLLLGDSGYPLRPWLLTPLPNADPNTAEGRYNERQMSTRSIIERCNGVLKLRFRCLLKHRVLHYAPERAAKIINTCVMLHNMCIEHNLPPVALEPGEVYENMDFGNINQPNLNVGNRGNQELEAERRMQQLIIQNHFQVQ